MALAMDPDPARVSSTPVFDRRAIPADATETFWQAADGWRIRRIDWPAPARAKGSILFMPGRGDCYEKYLETLDHWARAGWKVTASDWRGQAGSGRLGADKVTGHIGNFHAWTDDLALLWRQWTGETPGPHVLAGHSMGGELTLLATARGQVAPDGLILSAPMLGFLPAWLPRPILHAVARFMALIGDPRRPAWKWSEKPGQVPAGRMDLLTHDAERYADELWWREQRPELAMGPGSWGWIERAYVSFAELAKRGILERIGIPVHIVATDHDRLVSFPAIERAARRLPRDELQIFGEEARHEILREIDSVRDIAIEGIDRFLAGVAEKAVAAK
ncbi:MAG TPA: alpha/beta hydrolase [Sphingomonadaceae bacterium]